MTTIVSRPENLVAGEGPYLVRFTFEELQLIASLMYITRLGDGVYENAAFNITQTIEEVFGPDFIEEASDDVDLSISIENSRGDIIEQHHHSVICIEVGL